MTRPLPAHTRSAALVPALSAVLSALLLGACATSSSLSSAPARSGEVAGAGGRDNPQLAFKLVSGTYRCEEGARVDVRRDAGDPNLLQVGWKGETYPMLRNPSYSGLPRYEDAASGLVWIDLPWKSVLLDGRSGKPLVSECRSTSVS
jgi:hypothetical protein